jgi:hypothetical protein
LKEITSELVREHFNYDPETGLLTWRKKFSIYSNIKIGDETGCDSSDGYRRVYLFNKEYRTH